MADQLGKERIRNACVQCQKRKKRCDGGKPSCTNCSKVNASCQYKERRPRGPGKKNNRVEQLETRLKSLESALRLQEPVSNPLSEDQATLCANPAQIEGLEVEETDDSLVHNHSTPIESSQESAMSNVDCHVDLESNELTATTSNSAPTTLEAHQTPSPAQIISKYSEFSDGIKSAYHWIRAQENRGLNQSRVFARLPTYEQVRNLVEPIVEHLQQHGATINTAYFVELVDQQYSADPDSYTDDPARWAIVNSFFATAMLNRSTIGFLAEIVPTAWSYFNNAFSVFPDLITQGKDISACESLLAMAMFAQSTADAQLITQIIAAVTCLVQNLGLHRRSLYHSLDPIATRRHQRVFWTAYILDVDAMDKYDRNPSLGNEELGAPFEDDASSLEHTTPEEFGSLDILRWRAKLAVIQRRIHERLHPAKSLQMKREELLKTVALMYQELQAWRSSLPEDIRAVDSQDDGPSSASSIALLDYIFFNSMSKLQMAVVHLGAAERLEYHENLASGTIPFDFEIKRAWSTSAIIARDIIAIAVNLAPQPFFQVWGTLCYPLSAVLTLFSGILQSPTSAAAQDDIGRIEQFVDLLKRLASDGRDVQRLLNACIKLHDVASCAIAISKTGEHSQYERVALGRSITFSQLESIRVKLSNVRDWLQLAQGLLSNLPLLRMDAEEVLSGISGLGTPQGIYGLCVAELAKSQKYH